MCANFYLVPLHLFRLFRLTFADPISRFCPTILTGSRIWKEASPSYPLELYPISNFQYSWDTRPSSVSSTFVSCYSLYTFLPNRLSANINPLSPGPSAVSSPSYSNPKEYYSGGGPPTHPLPVAQQSYLSPVMSPGSSRSTRSSVTTSPSLYPQGVANQIHGWKPSSSSGSPARPPFHPDVSSQPIQTTHVFEPSIPTVDLHTPGPDSGGSRGTGTPIYTNNSPGPHMSPPVPHRAYSPSQLVNPRTGPPSCKTLVFHKKRDLTFVPLIYRHRKHHVTSRTPGFDTWVPTRWRKQFDNGHQHR